MKEICLLVEGVRAYRLLGCGRPDLDVSRKGKDLASATPMHCPNLFELK